MTIIGMPGGVLYRLGFRWVFPFGTLPIPYHPVVPLVFLLGPPLWIAWAALSAVTGGGAILWWQPLIPAAVIGVLMSIPFVSWGLLVFRAPLAQAALITGSMALLAIDVAAGRAAIGWAVLPAGFVALYVVQRIGGLVLLARLRRDAERWVPVDPGDATVIVRGDASATHRVAKAIAQANVARIIHVPKTSSRLTMHHWLSAEAIEALRVACGGVPPPGWSFPEDDGHLVSRPIAAAPSGGITLTTGSYRAPFRLVIGQLERIHVTGNGIDRAAVWGSARIVNRIPVFTALHWTAIVGQSSWHIGFMPDPIVRLDQGDDGQDRLARAFVPRPDGGGRCDDAQPLIEQIAAEAAGERARIDDFWAMIAADSSAKLDGQIASRLHKQPGLFRPGDGDRLAAWLVRAKAARRQFAVNQAASLLQRLPDPEFAAAGPAILAALNSRILAGEWRVGPDMDLDDVPRDCPRFGRTAGFGLLKHAPKLYDRVAGLGPRETEFVAKLRASFAGSKT